jgi:prepilin-type N-terminal cleavage/methylation domain-containing protein
MPTTLPDGRRGRAGFTLAEVLIATTISSFVMAAVISSFLMMGRSGANAYAYVGMESESRKGLERFGEDVRMAKNVTWASSTDVSLAVMHLDDTNTDTVRYYWDTATSSATYHCFLRVGPDPVTGASGTQILMHNVQNFEFVRWLIGTSGAATNDLGTKQLQLRLTLRQQAVTVVAATNLVVSARFVLRNKT